MLKLTKLRHWDARGGHLGIKLGLLLSVVYSFAMALILVHDEPNVLFLLFVFAIGCLASVVPSALLGFLTGWSIEVILMRFGARLSPRSALLVGFAFCFSLAFLTTVQVWGSWIGDPTFDPSEFWWFFGFGGLPALIYAFGGAWVTRQSLVVLRERGILPERAGEQGRALRNDAVPFVSLLGILGAWTVFISANGDSSVTENYLLPAGYEGPVVVVFDQENGAPAEQEGPERIYRIPEDGVLFTQFPHAGGYRAKFWYEDEAGERTEIPVVNSSCRAESADSPIFACNQGSSKFTNGRTILNHRAYIVGYEEEMSRYANRLTAIIDSVLWPLSEEP